MTFYELSVADTNLVGYHPRHGILEIKVLRENNLEGDVLGKIKIKRDNNGSITGIYASNGRAKNVWFEKLNKHHPELPAFLLKQSEKF